MSSYVGLAPVSSGTGEGCCISEGLEEGALRVAVGLLCSRLGVGHGDEHPHVGQSPAKDPPLIEGRRAGIEHLDDKFDVLRVKECPLDALAALQNDPTRARAVLRRGVVGNLYFEAVVEAGGGGAWRTAESGRDHAGDREDDVAVRGRIARLSLLGEPSRNVCGVSRVNHAGAGGEKEASSSERESQGRGEG